MMDGVLMVKEIKAICIGHGYKYREKEWFIYKKGKFICNYTGIPKELKLYCIKLAI